MYYCLPPKKHFYTKYLKSFFNELIRKIFLQILNHRSQQSVYNFDYLANYLPSLVGIFLFGGLSSPVYTMGENGQKASSFLRDLETRI